MSIRVEFQYQPSEYAKGIFHLQRAVFRSRQVKLRGLRVWFVALFVVLVVVFFLLMRQGRTTMPAGPAASAPAVTAPPPPRAVESVLGFLPWVTIFLVLWAVIYFVPRKRVKRLFSDDPSVQRQQTFVADEDGITLSDTWSTSRTLWPGVAKFEENADFAFFFISTFSAHMIPKHALTAAVLDQLRELAAAKISQPTQAFPVVPVAERAE